MNKEVALLLGVEHLEPAQFGPIRPGHVDHAGIAHLPAHFGVTGGLIKDNVEIAVGHGHHFDNRFRLQIVVAEKFCRLHFEPLARHGDHGFLFGMIFTGALALFIHQLLDTGCVHRQAALPGHELGKVQGEAVRVIQFKGIGTGNAAARLECGDLAREQCGELAFKRSAAHGAREQALLIGGQGGNEVRLTAGHEAR